MRLSLAVSLAAISFLQTISAQAALIDRGRGLIYDTDLNITWLQDWNLAKTSGYDSDGQMTWSASSTWADQLVYGGYSDWRLPSALNSNGSGPCSGQSCIGSEMGHLSLVELGNLATGTGSNKGPFTNVANFYWTNTDYAPLTLNVWYYFFSVNLQSFHSKSNEDYAVAVRNGDVTSVPELEILSMLAMGLAFLSIVARRRKRV